MKQHGTPTHRWRGTRAPSYFAIMIALALGALISAPHASWGQNTQGLLLRVVAPRRVREGEAIELRLVAEHGADIGGYETNLIFDTAAAHFSELQQDGTAWQAVGRDIGRLGVVESPQGVAFGAYSCPVAQCTGTHSGPKISAGPRGTIELASVVIAPERPGTLEIKLDGITFVDPAGHPISVVVEPQVLQVEVGAPGAGPLYRAPPGSARPAVSAAAPGNPDLTGDGRITHADAMEVALAWTQTRERAGSCGALVADRDINHDGCIDIADLQTVAASYSVGGPAQAAPPPSSKTFTVNSDADNGDAQIGDGICATSSGVCTLRAAITEANLNNGSDTIEFDIPGSDVHTIQTNSPLPSINDESGGTTIDGYTQPGATPNTDSLISNAVIKIEVVGGGADTYNGLNITSAINVIRGLALYNFHSAIPLYGSGSHDNKIIGNFVGTNAAGTYVAPETVGGASGIKPQEGAARNRIGTTALANRNVISGNAHNGVSSYNFGTNNNVIMNNIIGLTPRGDARLSNRNHGIDINSASSSNIIGGTGTREHNVVSGNGYEGIELSHGRNTASNKIIGNFVGTDLTGNNSPAYTYNVHFGIHLEDGPSNSEVAYNVVGSNHGGGITLDGFYSFPDSFVYNNKIHDNRVGISLNNSPIPNMNSGIQLDNHAYQNQIGPDNIVAYNPVGIRLLSPDTDHNTITRNRVFSNTGLGIDIQPLGWVNLNDQGDGDNGPNEQLNFPVLTGASPSQVIGSACAGCRVEVFLADGGAGKYGQGKQFAGDGVAGSNGAFNVSVSGLATGDYVTATATDANGNTSEFSLNFLVSGVIQPTATTNPIPTPTATELPTPTATDLPTPTATGPGPTTIPPTSPTAAPAPGTRTSYLAFVMR